MISINSKGGGFFYGFSATLVSESLESSYSCYEGN